MSATKFLLSFSILLVVCFSFPEKLFSQVELEPWGNISGIRIKGELMNVESRLVVVKKDWKHIQYTRKEGQRPKYLRKGNSQMVHTNIESIYFSEAVADAGEGIADISVEVKSAIDQELQGIYFSIFLPDRIYEKGIVRTGKAKPINLSASAKSLNEYFKMAPSKVQFKSALRGIDLVFPQPVNLIIKKQSQGNEPGLLVYIPLVEGNIKKGDSVLTKFTIKTSGKINTAPVNLQLNTANPGRPFTGLGGNFRLQNSRTDPQVIDYCLENLDVRASRVEMPWQLWQPSREQDPIEAAKAGKLNDHVRKSMEIARRLYQIGIPVILSAWSAPAWAVIGKPKYGPDAKGIWGNPLDSTKTPEIYRSIADYIVYLKEQYGVTISMFSFNESDLGINIRQTGREHAALIKGLGEYFVSRGLDTKMLLGDNSDATTYAFLNPALNDPETHPYIGAVSFHSWRGWDKPTLEKWSEAAARLQVPLIVGEGSIDAQAWGYPAIFEEPSYALKEIDLYVRILSICQPASILQWQLTADYSPLSGGGIFGDKGPLRPTQRFWNLKQLSSTPQDLKHFQLQSDAGEISAAALGDLSHNRFAFHLVNNGAAREVTLKGLPENITSLQLYITNQEINMKKEKSIPVRNGVARFTLLQTSYTSLFSE